MTNLIQNGLEQDARRVKERILMGAAHEKAQAVAERLKIFLEEHDWTQAGVAEKIGISTAVINQFLQNKYKGSLDELVNKVENLLDSVERKDRRIKNENFIETSTAKKIFTIIKQTDAFSNKDVEGKIGVIIGDAGCGKSRCLEEYSTVNRNVKYVLLDDSMTPTMMFNEIAETLGIGNIGSLAVITRKLIQHLRNRHIIIILDECSHLRVRQLNQLRQIIVVKCKCPLILSGNKDLLSTIMQSTERHGYESLDQFTSRLVYILNLDKLAEEKDTRGGKPEEDAGLYTVEDIRKLYEYGGIRLTSDGITTLRKICKTPRSGRLRTCTHVIEALHTSGLAIEAGKIDSNLILDAIEDLNLPVMEWLPFSFKNSASIQKKEESVSRAKTA